ncbi:replication initiator protein A [Lysinibacillus capsici]|uniref:replication initiator protein A n=1 Tax=Lysinibacillus capsici TaxID=2115968 RepID=UPI0034E2D0EF
MSEYYTVNEMYAEKFYQVPKVFFTNPLYKDGLSPLEKMAFGLLKDRFSLSKMNGWFDLHGRIYFIFTQEELMELFGCSNKTASNVKKNLIKVGLLEVRKRGQGNADWLYLKKPIVSENDIYEIDKLEKEIPQSVGGVETCKNYTSKNVKNTRQEVSKIHGNDTDINNTDINNTDFKESDMPNIINIDDDDKKRTSSPSHHNKENIDLIISNLREATKDELTDRSFNTVVRKVVDKYSQGKLNNFRDYLVTALSNKIEELELRRIKDQAEKELYESIKQQTENRLMNVECRKIVPFYNWLEERE